MSVIDRAVANSPPPCPDINAEPAQPDDGWWERQEDGTYQVRRLSENFAMLMTRVEFATSFIVENCNSVARRFNQPLLTDSEIDGLYSTYVQHHLEEPSKTQWRLEVQPLPVDKIYITLSERSSDALDE